MAGGGGEDTLRDDYQSAPHHDADRLNGGPDDDQLLTFGGNDVLEGGDGDDTLNDYGRDAGTMDGGAGDDVINDGINANPVQVVDGGPGTDKVTLYVDMMGSRWPRLTADIAAAARHLQLHQQGPRHASGSAAPTSSTCSVCR